MKFWQKIEDSADSEFRNKLEIGGSSSEDDGSVYMIFTPHGDEKPKKVFIGSFDGAAEVYRLVEWLEKTAAVVKERAKEIEKKELGV